MRLGRKGARGNYDLIYALRRNPTKIQAGADICGEAADTIERLTAERDEAVEKLTVTGNRLHEALNDRDALAEALKFYAGLPDSLEVTTSTNLRWGNLHYLGERARAALAQIKGGEDG